MYFGKIKRHSLTDRVPPNQNVTTSFPVLHAGSVPDYQDLSKWNLQIYGLVESPLLLTFDELKKLPQSEVSHDIHCVTGWSKLDTVWKGVKTKEIAKRVKPLEEARFVILHAEEGWTTNVPLDDFLRESSLLAHSYNGVPLTPEHGFPLRAVMPHLYFWKSAKWLRGIQFTKENHPGFWEKNGYHMRGDPWKEERYSFD